MPESRRASAREQKPRICHAPIRGGICSAEPSDGLSPKISKRASNPLLIELSQKGRRAKSKPKRFSLHRYLCDAPPTTPTRSTVRGCRRPNQAVHERIAFDRVAQNVEARRQDRGRKGPVCDALRAPRSDRCQKIDVFSIVRREELRSWIPTC
jgi:hypothetical protein